MKVDAVRTIGQTQQPAPQFTTLELRNELAREVNIRNTVYPGMVRNGRLTHAQAERQTAMMHAIWRDYCDRAEAEREVREPSLPFGEATAQAQTSGESQPSSDPTPVGEPKSDKSDESKPDAPQTPENPNPNEQPDPPAAQ